MSHVRVSVHARQVACAQATLSAIHQVYREVVVVVDTVDIVVVVIVVNVVPYIVVVELSGCHVRIIDKNFITVYIIVSVVIVYPWIA